MTNDEMLIQKRRKAILDAAVTIFDSHGYAATTMEAVAAQAGISKGSIYNYFKNKQDLFVSVMAGVLEGEDQFSRELVAKDMSASDKLSAYLDDWFDRLAYYRKLGGLILEFWATAARGDRDGAFRQIMGQIRQLEMEHLMAILRQGWESGELGDAFRPEIAAPLIMATIEGITIQGILNLVGDMNEEMLAAFKRAILAALRNGPKLANEIGVRA